MLVYQRVNVSLSPLVSSKTARSLDSLKSLRTIHDSSLNPCEEMANWNWRRFQRWKKTSADFSAPPKRILHSYIWGLFHKPLIIRILIKHPEWLMESVRLGFFQPAHLVGLGNYPVSPWGSDGSGSPGRMVFSYGEGAVLRKLQNPQNHRVPGPSKGCQMDGKGCH